MRKPMKIAKKKGKAIVHLYIVLSKRDLPMKYYGFIDKNRTVYISFKFSALNSINTLFRGAVLSTKVWVLA